MRERVTSKNRKVVDEKEDWSIQKIKHIKANLIQLEETTQKEITERGSAHNSTLSKYNRQLSYLHLYSGDVGLAEKYILLAFGYMKSNYNEALTISNAEYKSKVMYAIANDHIKLLKLFAIIKMSFSSTVSLKLLKDTETTIAAVSISQLLKDPSIILVCILDTLSNKIRRENIDFVDGEDIVHYIQSEVIETVTIDKTEYIQLQWLCVRIYQSFVKKWRHLAYTDTSLAGKLAGYRREAAHILHGLDIDSGAIDDLAESYLFDVLSVSEPTQWKRMVKRYSLELDKVVTHHPRKKKYVDSLYARMYIHGFNITEGIEGKYEYIKKAMDFSVATGQQYIERIMPYLYITELLIWLKRHKAIDTVVTKVTENHRADLNESIFQDETRSSAIRLYNATLQLISHGHIEESKNVGSIESIYHLHRAGIIRTEKILIDLLINTLSIQSNVVIEEVEEDNVDQDNFTLKALQNLDKWLMNEEGVDIEVKLGSDSTIKKIAASVCALANTNGGRVVVGLIEKNYFSDRYPDRDIAEFRIVAKKFVLVGQRSFDTWRQKLASYMKANIQVSNMEIHDIYEPVVLHIDNKDVLVLQVSPIFQQKKKLLRIENKVYTRNDNQTTEMSLSDVLDKVGMA